MVALQATSEKLRDRAERIVCEVCGVSRDEARALLKDAGGSAKLAIVMHKLRLSNAEARKGLDAAGGGGRGGGAAPAAARGGGPPGGSPRLDFDLGAWLADAAVAVMAESGVARADIAAI